MRDASLNSNVGDTVTVNGTDYVKTAGAPGSGVTSSLVPVGGPGTFSPGTFPSSTPSSTITQTNLPPPAVNVGGNVITDTTYEADPYTGSLSSIPVGPESFVNTSGQDVTNLGLGELLGDASQTGATSSAPGNFMDNFNMQAAAATIPNNENIPDQESGLLDGLGSFVYSLPGYLGMGIDEFGNMVKGVDTILGDCMSQLNPALL